MLAKKTIKRGKTNQNDEINIGGAEMVALFLLPVFKHSSGGDKWKDLTCPRRGSCGGWTASFPACPMSYHIPPQPGLWCTMAGTCFRKKTVSDNRGTCQWFRPHKNYPRPHVMETEPYLTQGCSVLGFLLEGSSHNGLWSYGLFSFF